MVDWVVTYRGGRQEHFIKNIKGDYVLVEGLRLAAGTGAEPKIIEVMLPEDMRDYLQIPRAEIERAMEVDFFRISAETRLEEEVATTERAGPAARTGCHQSRDRKADLGRTRLSGDHGQDQCQGEGREGRSSRAG
jgi:hypothetical protein